MTDDLADRWDALHAEARFRPRYPSEAVVRWVAGSLSGTDAVVVDLGCGAGRHIRLLADFGCRPIGLDVSLDGLRHLRVAMESPVALSAAAMIPLRAESADAVLAYGSLYYADDAGYRAAVDEIWRVLRPGGHLLVVTRTTRDHRCGRGHEIEPDTWLQAEPHSPDAGGVAADLAEQGMPIRFLDRDRVDDVFGRFDPVVDLAEFTQHGGRERNSDWIVGGRKPSH